MASATTVRRMTAELSNAELLAAGLGGDEMAWRQLVDRLEGAIWGAISRLGLRHSVAEDVYQTVWLRLLDRHETIRDPEALAGWLKQVTHREALAVLRAAGKEFPSELLDLEPDHVDGPEIDLTRRTNNELLVKGFDKLDERCKDLLYMVATDVPYQEMANKLGLRIGTIGSTRKRCLDKLRSFDETKQAMEPPS